MRIVDIRERAIPLKSDMRNSSFDFSEMTTSVVAVLTDVVRDGARVTGFSFNSTGRYACGATMRARLIPRILRADPETLPGLIQAVRACEKLRLEGLMTMPPWSDDPQQTRPYFRRLAALAREHGLSKLSMGMSHDLEAAIEEGATIVRIGTALFGKRRKA